MKGVKCGRFDLSLVAEAEVVVAKIVDDGEEDVLNW